MTCSTEKSVLKCRSFKIGPGQPLLIIAGPCVIENEEHCLRAAEELKNIFSKTGLNFIFKSSYDKANRSSVKAYRGPGVEKGLRILQKVKDSLDIPVTTDVHTPEEARAAAEVCEIIQIPALLCRQTDLLVAAGETGAIVNVKKGQFMAPWDMGNVIDKVRSTGNEKVILTDRGTIFGYNNLVCDMRSIPIMSDYGVPVCFDATHAVQLPGGRGDSSDGQREFIPTLAKSAVAAGCHCVFMEAHPNPPKALCDKDSVIDFKQLPALLEQLERIHQIVQ